MKKRILLIAAFLGFLTLAGCGGGGGDVVLAADSDAVISVGPNNGSNVIGAIINKDFVYATGVPEFGTTGQTTVTFITQQNAGLPDNAAPGNPAFRITSSTGETATGIVEFGSCGFRVVTSNFSSTSPLASGKTVTISNCAVRLVIAGAAADNTGVARTVILILNSRSSNGETLIIQISPNGTITINGFVVGTVGVHPVTGG
jgi:hypothetical protein